MVDCTNFQRFNPNYGILFDLFCFYFFYKSIFSCSSYFCYFNFFNFFLMMLALRIYKDSSDAPGGRTSLSDSQLYMCSSTVRVRHLLFLPLQFPHILSSRPLLFSFLLTLLYRAFHSMRRSGARFISKPSPLLSSMIRHSISWFLMRYTSDFLSFFFIFFFLFSCLSSDHSLSYLFWPLGKKTNDQSTGASQRRDILGYHQRQGGRLHLSSSRSARYE